MFVDSRAAIVYIIYYTVYTGEVPMKFVTVRDFRAKSAQLWKNLRAENRMVVTSNGKPIALLTPLSEETLDTTLSSLRTAKAIAAVHAMQMRSLMKGNDRLSLDQINEEIAAHRRERGKRNARSH